MATIDYKEKYEQALEMAKYYHDRDNIQFLKNIFPELKESEDERIRKAIIEHFACSHSSMYPYKGFTKEQIIAWLEKQTEHANFRNKIQIGDKVTRNEDGVLVNLSQLNRVAKKQGEQKPVEDKIWSIYDAKDGDVLSWDNGRYTIIFKELKDNKIIAHCSYNNHSEHFGTQGNYDTTFDSDLKFIPATKEQHDLLFQKMKESGYVFDFENKQLRKIKQNPWSEEDVAMLDSAIAFVEHSAFTTIGKGKNNVIAWLKSIRDKAQPQPQPRQEWSEEDERNLDWLITVCERIYYKSDPQVAPEGALMLREWLKYLKDKYTWKPSDEQIMAIDTAINVLGKGTLNGKQLIELYQDLKKLKGEEI